MAVIFINKDYIVITMLIQKMKQNKKLLIVLIAGLFLLAGVNATVLLFYGQLTANIVVTQPITVTGTTSYTIDNGVSGQTMLAPGMAQLLITNNANFDITANVSNDAPDGIRVNYDYASFNETGPLTQYWQTLSGNTITIPTNGYVRLEASYSLDKMLATGTYTITTTIK